MLPRGDSNVPNRSRLGRVTRLSRPSGMRSQVSSRPIFLSTKASPTEFLLAKEARSFPEAARQRSLAKRSAARATPSRVIGPVKVK
jgi:hypothetical protein